MTYRDIELRANALAGTLNTQGLEHGHPVGVLTERSAMLPIALLAILKAGGVYVPMAANLPTDRLVNIAQQSGMQHLIALDGLPPPTELLNRLNQTAKHAVTILRPDDLRAGHIAGNAARPRTVGNPTDVAAILFTSGSTGQPKGVQLQHDAIINMAYGHIEAQKITSKDRVLLATAPGFILGLREVCTPLLAGAAFVPASRDLLDEPTKLLEMMSRHRVSIAHFTPSYLRLFGGAVPTGLRCLITAGERPNAEDARSYARTVEYWNIHGATEVCGTICMMRVDPHGHGQIPSGRPFANTSVHLLDADGQDVPQGEIGEIYVVGQGIARGYIGQPDLTASSFVQTRYGRAYRSRDLGRWTPEGNLVALGRASDVVKVSGQSVSLGEIELTLMRHPEVHHAVAIQHDGKIIAFVKGAASIPAQIEIWHAFLGKTLPSYMLPARVLTLADFPTNTSGKVDRQALLALATSAQTVTTDPCQDPPTGETEQHIAAAWEDVLNIRPIQRNDNYFSLGGTSLLAIAISQRLLTLGHNVAARTILTAPTIAALAKTIAQTSIPTHDSASAHTEGAATKGQEDFWISATLGLATTGAQITRILSIKGKNPTADRWKKAWAQLVTRHPALRTAFFTAPDASIRWRTILATDIPPDAGFSIDHVQSADDARRCIAARVETPFSLTQPPLARAGLVELNENSETLFWFTLHHAVADGLSARILQEEMHAILLDRPLSECLDGTAIAAQAEQEYLASPIATQDSLFWRNKLDALAQETTEPVFGELPTDSSRPVQPSGKTAPRLTERLDVSTVATLTQLAQSQQVGLHALLLTLLAAEARRRSGRSTLVLGSGVSVRPAWAEAAVGYFVNVPPLVLHGDETLPLAAHIRNTQAQLTEALEHASYPTGMIYREFRQRHPNARSPARTSLFDISLTANSSRSCGNPTTDFSLTPRPLPGEVSALAAGLDLAFSHEPLPDSGDVELALVWNPDIYRQETAQAWLSGFAAWARWLAEVPARINVPQPPLLPEEVKKLSQWEYGPSIPRPNMRIHEVFEAFSDQHPDAIAIATETSELSFSALDAEANRIAQILIRHGVSQHQPVAILTECSPSLPAAILAVWKVGAVYLPLSVEQPQERLAFIAKDAGAKIVIALDGLIVPSEITDTVTRVLRPESEPRRMAERPKRAGSPQDSAYIIYTSGTTGQPKGVALPHEGVINVACTSAEATGLTHNDRVALVTTPGFDASIWELSIALVNGLALVPVSRALRDDPWALKKKYHACGVTVAFHTPSYLRISKETPFEGLRILITGGEAPNHQDARDHASYLDIWNAYGPTETTIIASMEKLSATPQTDRPLSTGHPIPNARISIRSDTGMTAPPGAVGEVWLGGVGLAQGYLNNPVLTAKHFIETSEGRFYRTGDLGRWTTDGRLELQGRMDHQVKLHGQRIELGEIEKTLQSHPNIAEAIVVMAVGASETKTLHGFIRLNTNAAMPSEDDWRTHLRAHLPPHMIPASITEVALFPLTPSGKLDRKALLNQLTLLKKKTDQSKTPPKTPLEIRIAAVWHDLLNVTVKREDNFFALGGNSLLAVTLAHRLSQDFEHPISARDLFAAPILSDFVQRVAKNTTSTHALTERLPESDHATEGQKEFWVAEAAGLDTRTFTIPLIQIAVGSTQPVHSWRTAWAKLVARHESLRTAFVMAADGTLHRIISPPTDDNVAFDYATRPDTSSALVFIRQCQQVPFSMASPPLWRVGIVAIESTGEQMFWLALHHSVGDGQSVGILSAELSALLRGENLPEITGCFAHTAARENAYLTGPEASDDAQYWNFVLAQVSDSAFEEGQLDTARSSTAAPGTHRFEACLDNRTTQHLKTLAQNHNTSLHAVILALLAWEARRRTGRNDVIVGTTTSVRETAADGRNVGYYVNMLPIVVHMPQNLSFGALLNQTGRKLSDALTHARYPFARIYQNLRMQRSTSRHPARYPIFDIAVTENPPQNAAPTSIELTRLSNAPYEYWHVSPGEDMVLSHEQLADGRLILQWHVNAAIYSRETAESWFTSLRDWAAWLTMERQVENPLPSILPNEAVKLDKWEYGAKIQRPPLRFHEIFEQQIDLKQQNSDTHIAILTQTFQRTYAEVECDANTLAHAMIKRNVRPGDTVGVLTGRSTALTSTVLAIWKAAATYLPLSADLPAERLSFMARDTGIRHLIALDGLKVPAKLAETVSSVLRPEVLEDGFKNTHTHRPQLCGSPDDIAYIIYTSGTTGRPKGVRISHRSYVNMILGTGEAYGLTTDDRSLIFSSPSFDVSLSDIGLPLAFGATVCPVSYDILSAPNQFRTFLNDLKITVADITPSYLRLFDGAALPSVRILVTGGEAPYPIDVQRYAARQRYYNAYGPTENTISSTMAILSAEPQAFVSGGCPLPNTSIHVCDTNGNPVPPGVVGELWLGGTGLAQGYVGRPDLTASTFIQTAWGRRYRTGDMGRWHTNGNLEIMGRVDDQVKLNGIRVELGEIESALVTHPDIAQAVVILDHREGHEHSLWAFVSPRPGRHAPSENSWRDYLADRLPGYMIPSMVITVTAIPLSDSGKVDKSALKRLLDRQHRSNADSSPEEGLESKIAGIWQDLLKVQNIRRDDNFFSLGGHSLLAIAMIHRMETLLGYPVPARDLFAEPTLQGFARRINQTPPSGLCETPTDLATQGQREFWVAEQAGLDTRGFIIPLSMIVQNAENISESQWHAAWAAMIDRHDALRTGFRIDEAGTLRRFTETDGNAELEITEQPDLDAALSYSQSRQGKAFVMSTPPLWRAGIVRIRQTQQTLFWISLHHSVADGVSLGILTNDLTKLLQGQTLPPLSLSLDQGAGRESTYLLSPDGQTDFQYWRQTLAKHGRESKDTTASFDEWPLDFARPDGRTAHTAKGAHTFRIPLDANVATRLRTFASKNGASLHALFLTLMALEISRRCERSEFLLGTAASTRETTQESELIGYFVNMLPVSCRIDRAASVEQNLRMMQAALADGLQHVHYPFALIYQDFRRDHTWAPSPARYPLFDFAVAENPGEVPPRDGIAFVAPPTLSVESYSLRPNAPAQDMVLVHEGRSDGSLMLQWYVNAALYEKETAEAWINALAGWADFITRPSRAIETPLPALLPVEKSLLSQWEYGPALALPASFPAQFDTWCKRTPDSPAIISEQGSTSYAALNVRVTALAHALRKNGIKKDEPIGVFTRRSIHLPEIVLAIWKAGACYVPLATDLPADRLAFIAQDAALHQIVVSDGQSLPPELVNAGYVVLRPETLLQETFNDNICDTTDSKPEDFAPAYIIYTSGSTGIPKGVVLSHQGLNNLGVALSSALGIKANDRVLLMASPAFDAWISDLAMAWSAGAAIVPVVRSEMDDIEGMRLKLSRLEVTVATMPPSYLRLFEKTDFSSLRMLMTVGEPPITADAKHYATRLRYINGYGPTENTAAATVGVLVPSMPKLTAGKPLANTEVHIYKKNGEPVPPGTMGEIWLGGKGVALGYLNQPEQTAANFVQASNGRLYRTGDLGRWTQSSDLQILGRTDNQIKLRGQRIELGEIEHIINTHPDVSQCVALVGSNPNGRQSLWAFVCLSSGAVEPSQNTWHDFLAKKLPSYMLPSSIIRVSAIPLTSVGKVDRSALLGLICGPNAIFNSTEKYQKTPPLNEKEQRIAQIWSEHLERPIINREDNFFDIGGDSLRAIAVVNQLRRTFRCEIVDLYEHPCLADFTEICQHRPAQLRTLIQSATHHWQDYHNTLSDYEAERTTALAPQWDAYKAKNIAYQKIVPQNRRSYEQVLLTGATGYLGCYLLRELMAQKNRSVTVLVRGADDSASRSRLGDVLRYYFGTKQATAIQNAPQLTVRAGDLRRDDLGLAPQTYEQISRETQAIYHCAANVKHFGHYTDFSDDNVSATARLLKLAARRSANPADFHFVSTLSTCGKAPETGFHLFTEYDEVPDTQDKNYYIRSKQEAERLVVAARQDLANATIYRVGNVVFAAEGGPLQRNIQENAFFRQLAAFLRLGMVPNDSHLWLCHVDLVARGLVLLAETSTLANEIHHIENSHRETLATFIRSQQTIQVGSFNDFLNRLSAAIDNPDINTALTETLENFGLYRGISPQAQARRLETVSTRTQMLLSQLGLSWPKTPPSGQATLLRHAAQLFTKKISSHVI